MPSLPEELNEQQAHAVEHARGPLLVLAPVGTGKTTVIARRAAFAIQHGIDPAHMLCLSFTNRAAQQIKARVTSVVPRLGGEITVRTFHGLCAHILRHDAETLGIAPDFTISDEEDAKDLLLRLAGCDPAAPGRDNLGRVLMGFVEHVNLAALNDEPILDTRGFFESALQRRGDEVFIPPGFHPDRVVREYNQALLDQNVLDFAGLIRNVNLLLRRHPECLARWQRLFTWIQVDEVQDTNETEYRILSALAHEHQNLAFFGDIDQTIYEWRDSQPFKILGIFKREFHPVRELALTRNYRSSRGILDACATFIKRLPNSVTRRIDADSDDPGCKIVVHEDATLQDEGDWIATTIKEVKASYGLRNSEIAILTRSNATGVELSRILTRHGVSHFVIDNLRFFRRPEVKDALALVRLLVNRFDHGSLVRVLKRVPGFVRPQTIDRVLKLPVELGLRLSDLVDPITYRFGDPFGLLLEALADGQVVVFDVEATGLDTARDEVVELAAIKLGPDGELARFHAYVRPTRPVGDSVSVHGLSDDFLLAEGRPAAEVFAEFAEFTAGSVLVGHNVHYDASIVGSQAERLGLTRVCQSICYDTLDMTRRFFRLQRYTLQNICRELNLEPRPSHRAMDDVEATVPLLSRLVECVRRTQAEREARVAELRGEFDPFHRQVREWTEWLDRERPIIVLDRVLRDSGLESYWRGQPEGPKRASHLRELVSLFERYDDPALPPRDAMLSVIHLASLGNEADRYIEREDKVLLITAHQAKGLEFDTVFVAGATDGQFPSRHSVREGKLAEEHRLFYVAMTRARRRLFISYHQRDAQDRRQTPSRFIALIPESLCEQTSPCAAEERR